MLVFINSNGAPFMTPRDWSPRLGKYKERLKRIYDALPTKIKVPKDEFCEDPRVVEMVKTGVGFLLNLSGDLYGPRCFVYLDAGGEPQMPSHVSNLYKKCLKKKYREEFGVE